MDVILFFIRSNSTSVTVICLEIGSSKKPSMRAMMDVCFFLSFSLNLDKLYFSWLKTFFFSSYHLAVVSLSLLCSFSQMKKHTRLKIQKGDDVPDETIQTLAGILRKSSFLKVSEDGEFLLTYLKLFEPRSSRFRIFLKAIPLLISFEYARYFTWVFLVRRYLLWR